MVEQSLTLKDPFDYSDNIATTKWVQDHRWSSKVDRWKMVFDCKNEKMNWGYEQGIKGGRALKPQNLNSIYVQGERVRFFVSYNEMNLICLTGEFYDDRKMLCGTTLYDGETVFSITVAVDLKNGSIAIYGYDITNSKDVSKLCSLMKIQITW